MKEERRYTINGILGTIILHLLILFIFLVIKLDEVKNKHLESLQIEFLEEFAKIEEILAQKQEQVDMPTLDAQVAKNIAVNVSEKMNKEISTDKYIEELKDELGIEELKQQHNRELLDDNSPEFRENIPDKKKEEGKKPQQYKGKTNITVSLFNRSIKRQNVPVYLCEGGGIVVIDIIVDQSGNVISASYSNNSESKDVCLIEQAINSSNRYLFNSDPSADPRQKGIITFQFIPQ